MHPGTVTAVASRSVRTTTLLLPERGTKVSSPTTVWTAANACTVHDGWAAPEAIDTSTRAVALWASTTWKVTSSDSTSGVACSKAAQASHASATSATTTTGPIVTRRLPAGGGADV